MANKTSERPEIRTFSLDEAMRALSLVRPIVHDIVQNYGKIRELVDQLNARPGEIEAQDRLESLKDDLLENVDELHQLGVELKSFEMGLVDFYSLRDGKVIFLCWKLGEEGIGWWHPLEDGFDGRRPLTPSAGPPKSPAAPHAPGEGAT